MGSILDDLDVYCGQNNRKKEFSQKMKCKKMIKLIAYDIRGGVGNGTG